MLKSIYHQLETMLTSFQIRRNLNKYHLVFLFISSVKEGKGGVEERRKKPEK